MKIESIIKNRVSQTDFLNDRVDIELLIELLDIAVYAPNHKMREPWRFIIIDENGKHPLIKRYLETKKGNIDEITVKLNKIFNAPVVVAFIMPHQSEMKDEIEDLQAIAALIQNFLLLLTEKGLGSFWKTPAFIESDLFKEILHVEVHEMIVGLIQVGYPSRAQLPKKRQSAHSKTTIYN